MRKSFASLIALWLAAVLPQSAQAQSSTRTYTYDALGRLTEVEETGGANDGSNRNYTYDDVGNRTRFNSSGNGPGGSAHIADFVIVWSDDDDGNSFYQIHGRGLNSTGTQAFPERTINTVHSGQQYQASVAANQTGDFVTVWEDDADENGYYQIKARGINADGTERFSERTVNSVGAGQQLRPQVAMADDGRFVVVWEDDADENGFYEIEMRGFNADGSQSFAQNTIHNAGDGRLKPQIAMSSNGNFVVVWEDDADKNGWYQIRMRGFNADGSQRFSERTVNTVAAGQQLKPHIAMADGGDFVVVWEDDADNNGFYEIEMRGYYTNGSERFAQTTANASGEGWLKPSAGMASDGTFVVAWEGDADNNGYFNVHMRGFNANGTQRFSQRMVNSVTGGQQLAPRIAMADSGNFMVVWEDDFTGSGTVEIVGRGFNANGSEAFADMVVNSVTNSDQREPAIAAR